MQLVQPSRQRLMVLLVVGRIWLVRFAYYLCRLLPLRRRLVLATAHHDHISGNLVAIRDELARRQPAIEVVELAYRSTRGLRGAISGALNSLLAGYYLATSRVFVVDDYFFPLYVVRRRRGTLAVQVWHACGAFKRFGHSIGDRSFGANPALTKRVRIHTNYDVCVASSEAAAQAYAEAFDVPLERFLWSVGVPRTDVLLREPDVGRTRDRLRRAYDIPPDRRAILYAPTFRGDRTYAAQHPTQLDLRLLRDALHEDHLVLLRMHPFVRSRARIEADLAEFIIDVSDHPEINELMLASDVLLTDYSSVIFEFALLRRPIVFFAPDHEAYERERGFYFDYREEGPGPVFTTTAELAAYLRSGMLATDRLETFARRWFSVADGRAAERFVDRLVMPGLDGHGGVRSRPENEGR